MSKKEILSAEISVEDKASKQLDKIVNSIEKQTLELLKLQKAGTSSEKGMDKMTKSVVKQNNEILRLKASLDKTRRTNQKKMKVDVDTKQSVRMVDRLERSFRTLRTSAGKTRSALKGIGSGLSKLNPGLLMGSLGVAGGAYAGKQVFDGTFGAAAQYEMSEKVIQAMFNNKKKAQEYMNEMQKTAIDSPLLNSQDIFSNSKSYIALTKNQDQLNEMWDLSERLLAVDPAQGIEGAVFALRELFSGDSRSLAERFELSKKTLNDIKNLPLDQQLRALDKYFKKMGMTKKLVNEMGDTTLGTWNQIKETMQVGLRKIGDPAVDIIKPYLKEINKGLQGGKLNRFVKFGQTMSKGIATGFVSVTKGIGGWIDKIVNDPAYQKLDNIPDKFTFVLHEVKKSFDGWYENEGKATINTVVSGLVSSLVTAIENNISDVTSAGFKIGASIASGIVSGISSNPIISTLAGAGLGGMIGGPLGALFGAVTGAGVGIGGKINKYIDSRDKKEAKRVSDMADLYSGRKGGLGGKNAVLKPSYAYGSPRIPYNNYPALLHEGEKVLTKQQANQSERKQSPQVLITGNEFNVREESDIHKIAAALVKEIKKAQLSYGGAMG